MSNIFTRLFGKKSSDEENENQEEAVQEQGNIGNQDRLAQAAGNQDAEAGNQEDQSSQPATRFQDMEAALQSSKKGIFGNGKNSGHYDKVNAKLGNVIEYMNKELPSENIMESQKMFIKIMKAYSDLITACEEYSNRRFIGISFRGSHRHDIVKQIKKMAQTDLASFRGYFDVFPTLPKEQRAKNVSEVLEAGRQRVLQLADGKKESGLKHVGGAASYIGVINKGDLEDKDVSGYFKEEDVFTKMDAQSEALMMLEQMRERMPISDANYQKIRTYIEEYRYSNSTSGEIIDNLRNKGDCIDEKLYNDNPEVFDLYHKNQEFHDFIDVLHKACSSKNTVSTYLGYLNIHLEEGQSINMSKRNVAASRIANLLGVGDLIAQSETAQLKDADGKTKTGNLMQAARGIEAGKLIEELAHGKNQKQASAENGNSAYEKKNILTPEFLKSLTSLQVLDNLICQVDRHLSNYMVEMTEKGLGRVQGIDNDFAFGHGESKKDGLFIMGGRGRSIFKGKVTSENEDKAELSIPYMDKALAERICEVTEQDVRLLLYDVLEPEAVDSFVHRLKIMQMAIKKDLEEKSDRYLENDDDWGKEEVIETFSKDGEKYIGTDTYVGSFASTYRVTKSAAGQK